MCHLNLIARGPIISEEDAATIDGLERERNRALYKAARRRHARDHPVIQAFGPWIAIPHPHPRPSNHHPLGRGWSYAPIAPLVSLTTNAL